MNLNGNPNIKHYGRPAKYQSPEQMDAAIEDYFESCSVGEEFKWVDKKGAYHCATLPIPPSTEALSLFLGFTDRSALIQYETRNEGHEQFVTVIKRAKSRIAAKKLALAEMGILNDRVVMFDLAVNHGYIQEINVNFNEVRQLSDQDRLLLGNVLKQLPSQLRALPQAAIEAEVTEIAATESSNQQEAQELG